MTVSPARRLVAEALGTGLLVATVVGSGVMGVQMAGGNDALALLGNTVATGAILFVLIAMLGPVSGAHFNPAVTLVMGLRGDLAPGLAVGYGVAQILGGIAGTLVAHGMFALDAVTLSATIRSGPNLVFAELIASFGLVIVILGGLRHGTLAVAGMVGLYITAGYWFTASTSFANPAVTIARALTDTFSGIRPADVPWFIAAQLCGAVLALVLGRWLFVAPAPTATSDAAAPVQLTDEGARDQRAA